MHIREKEASTVAEIVTEIVVVEAHGAAKV